MPSQYKEARICDCGYTTLWMSNWSSHSKRCKLIPNEKDVRITSLEKDKDHLKQELDAKDRQLQMKDKQIAAQTEELTAKDRQIEDKEEQLKYQREELIMFKQLLADSFNEVKQENKQLRKRRQAPRRVHRTEPERRKIAKRQHWLCAGKKCPAATRGEELDEYDIDHIIPLSLGGTENLDNLQALCPGCHRSKTDQERLMRPNAI